MIARDTPLLARYAEGLFWMARYLERVENLARLVDVTQTFESPGREHQSWAGLLAINSDEAAYAARIGAVDPWRVKHFYLLDSGNPTSIPAALEMARTNARTLRPMISTEMWSQLNQFHRTIMSIRDADLQGDALSRLCGRIKEGVQAHTGITEGTFFRDQGWHFYEMGRVLERADQTTRLLDIKFHLLGPSVAEERRVTELTQWGAVLRAAAGYHAFRRVAQAGFTPEDIVEFLLADTSFARSVALCVSQLEWHVGQLRTRYGLRRTAAALERIEEVRAAVQGPVEKLLPLGLHEFLDGVQGALLRIAAEIGTAYFRDWRPLEQSTGSMSQGMGDGMTQTMAGMTQSFR